MIKIKLDASTNERTFHFDYIKNPNTFDCVRIFYVKESATSYWILLNLPVVTLLL